ncbi:MAG: InlB B-repeat-containing protein, partial [Treponema sp.]|nr:InlB B-repeat-containing protein [Treponema sp.]
MRSRSVFVNFGLVLFVLICAFTFLACNNPIVEKWWAEDKCPCSGLSKCPCTGDPGCTCSEPSEPVISGGGSGDNFAFVIFDTNGGTPQPKALKITWGGVVGRLRPINRGNNGFLGWFDENGNLWDIETRQVKKTD